jgi:hypothetical protein
METKLKVGDKVLITNDKSQLNHFMVEFCGKTAIVVSEESTNYGGQECKLDIDGGDWCWYYKDKCEQITKCIK